MASNKRSGLQKAADLARAAGSAAHIAKAAAVSGIQGAAIATAKEALPFLVKLALGLLIATVIIPMLVFSALPNMFFGYDTSLTDSIVHMTDQAMLVGGTYMSLEDFESAQIDSTVTSLVAEYEESGTTIDRIKVNTSFTEEDLLWFIAINSVAYRQDLDAMSAETIRTLCTSKLSYTPLLGVLTGDDDSTITTLTVTFQKLDPDEMMEQLGFDDDAKMWAGAIYETLSESDALTKYGSYYESYRPSYSGDHSYVGGVEHGGSYDNSIDLSNFTDPTTKNNKDLAAYAIQAWENNWGYVWGTYGNVLTQSLFDYKLEQYPDGVGNYKNFIEANWLGRRTTDCIGLVKGYGWLDTESMTMKYGTNSMPDYGANQMHTDAVNRGAEHGAISTIPEIPGLVLWKEGHTGVYVGGGYAIEAMGTEYGVVKTQVVGRGWQEWYKIPYISYEED